MIKHDLGEVLLELEELHREAGKKASRATEKPSSRERGGAQRGARAASRSAALDRILERLRALRRGRRRDEQARRLPGGDVRKLEEPLAVVIQSSSAAGKSSLMDAVLALMPEEERVQYSAMTGQSLFYMGETDLKHKVLAIVEEEGAERASYALKLLQSEGELTIASTGKDPATGKLVTQEYRVEGPVMIFLTTTAVEIDEELLNRCIVLTVDEEREQTRAIHERQRAGADARGHARAAGAGAHARAAPERAAPAPAASRREPVRAGADVPDHADADAARPHEVPDADPERSRCCTSTSGR